MRVLLLLGMLILLATLLGLVHGTGAVKSDRCTGDYKANGRPPSGTKCAEVDNKVCYAQSGSWGNSWCYTDNYKTNWGAECVECSAVKSDICTGDYKANGRPPSGTKCAKVDNKVCYVQSGSWGNSWCYTDTYKTNWGAECVECSAPLPHHGSGFEERLEAMEAIITNLTIALETIFSNISANKDNIGTNKDNIGTNMDNIGTNKDNIGTNMDNIGTNMDNIGTNKDNIGTNMDNITSITENIAVTTPLPHPGPGLEERLETVEAMMSKLETCLADVDSDMCPISQNGKTSVVDATIANTEAIAQFHPPQPQFNLVVTAGIVNSQRSKSVELVTSEGVCTSSTIPPLPVSLYDHESVYHQGHLMVCGGKDSGTQSKCYLLKNSTSEWKEGPTMTRARLRFSMIQAENVVYAIGGPFSGVLSIEKLVGDQWELIPQTITSETYTGANSQHCAVYLKSKKSLVVIGGATTNRVVALNLLTGEWTDLAPLPVASLRLHRCSVIQDVIYVAGGYIQPTYQKKVYRYEHEGGSWETALDLTETRVWFGMDVMDNKLVVVGGETGAYLDGIESMEENEVWTKTSYSLPEPRGRHALSAVPRKDFGCNN